MCIELFIAIMVDYVTDGTIYASSTFCTCVHFQEYVLEEAYN